MATSRELLNKLNDLYEKIVKYQDMSIMNVIPNPKDIITEYNNYITAKFRYDDKLQSLQQINMQQNNLSALNNAVASIKSDRDCIAKRVKPQRAGGIFDWFRSANIGNGYESIEDKIDELERQQKYLAETPIKSININLREEYNAYVNAIKKYKTTLRTANKSDSAGGTNVLQYINEYIETIKQLEQLKCPRDSDAKLEYPLIDLERKIGESVKKTRTQTAQVSPISPSIKKYMDEIKELNKKLRSADAEKAQLSAKVAKYGIDTMRKSTVSSAVKVGKIKDLLKVQKQVELAPGEVQVIYNPNTGKTRDPNTGKEMLMPAQRGFNVGNGIGQPQTTSAAPFQNFGSASVQLSSPNPLLNVTGSAPLPIEAQINAQKSLINLADWKPIIEKLRIMKQEDLQKFLKGNIDSSYYATTYFNNIYNTGFSNADEAALAAMLTNNGSKSIKDLKDLLRITEHVPNPAGKPETPAATLTNNEKKANLRAAIAAWASSAKDDAAIKDIIRTYSTVIYANNKRTAGNNEFNNVFLKTKLYKDITE